MPNRILKESVRTSKKVNELSDFEYRVWSYLITYVDDFGRGSADPELLKGLVFPRRKGITETQIKKALDNLANIGMVILYMSDDEPYFYFPNWDKHQQMRAKKSKFPAPDINCNQMISTDIKCSRNPIQSEYESNPNTNPKGKDARARFSPPTVDDVRDYCLERKNGIDAEQFVDFYSAKGWKVGSQPMKDWKAAVRTWERRRKGNNSGEEWDFDDFRRNS